LAIVGAVAARKFCLSVSYKQSNTAKFLAAFACSAPLALFVFVSIGIYSVAIAPYPPTGADKVAASSAPKGSPPKSGGLGQSFRFCPSAQKRGFGQKPKNKPKTKTKTTRALGAYAQLKPSNNYKASPRPTIKDKSFLRGGGVAFCFVARFKTKR
jgi:hypothetical protein